MIPNWLRRLIARGVRDDKRDDPDKAVIRARQVEIERRVKILGLEPEIIRRARHGSQPHR